MSYIYILDLTDAELNRLNQLVFQAELGNGSGDRVEIRQGQYYFAPALNLERIKQELNQQFRVLAATPCYGRESCQKPPKSFLVKTSDRTS